MPSNTQTNLCRYYYDALDSLIGLNRSGQNELQRFYCKSQLATEIQGQTQITIMQQGDQILAQKQRMGGSVETYLLATDKQRSVLHSVDQRPRPGIVYCPYGYHPAESGLTNLLEFNGERRDAITGRYLLGNGHRAFNPVLMRFASQDRLSPFDKGGLNAYCYCSGDPVNRNDPTGRFFNWVSELPSLFTSKQLNSVVKTKKPWFMLDTMEIDVIKEFYGTPDPFRKVRGVQSRPRIAAKFNPRAHGRVEGQQKNWATPRSLGQLSNDLIDGRMYVDAPPKS